MDSKQLIDLEFFARRQEFVEAKKNYKNYIIMYRTYYGDSPSAGDIDVYQKECAGVYDEDDDHEYDEDHDEDYED